MTTESEETPPQDLPSDGARQIDVDPPVDPLFNRPRPKPRLPLPPETS